MSTSGGQFLTGSAVTQKRELTALPLCKVLPTKPLAYPFPEHQGNRRIFAKRFQKRI